MKNYIGEKIYSINPKIIKKKNYNCVAFRHLSEERRKEWQELWNTSDLRHIFNSPDFFEACCEAFKIRKRLVIFCYRKGKLCGALPLIEDRVFGIKAFSGPGRKGNYADKSSLLVSEYNREIINALLVRALELGNIYLAEVDENIKQLLDLRKFSCVVEWASRSPWMMLTSETDVLGFMPRRQRRGMLRRIRRRENDLEFRFFKTDLEEALETVIEIEKRSHKPRRHMALFEKAEVRNLFQILIKRNPASIRIGVLYFQKKPAATYLGFMYGNVFAGYYTSFLEEYQHWGAGKMVFYLVLKYLKKEGFVKADLLRGDSELKRQFAKNVKDQYNVYFSKNYAVLLWWRICIPIRNTLKRTKSFVFSRTQQGLATRNYGKMKYTKKPIIIFSSYDDRKNPYYGGGGAMAVHEVAKRLTTEFKVHILTGKYPGCFRHEVSDDVHYERIGSCLFGPKIGHLFFHFVLPFYVARRVFDLWIESFTPPFSTSFLPLFTNKPVIGLVHMLSSEDMRRKYKLPFHLIENLGLKSYRYIIATSVYFRDHITARNPQAHIVVISNGVCLDEFRKKSDFKLKYISFLGRIEVNQKGLDLLLEAYRRITKYINIPLVIAGSGSSQEVNTLKGLIQKLDLEKQVVLKGHISEKERGLFLHQSFLHIIPSRFETFSLVALETLASGTPLVTFNIKGLQWLPERCCIKAVAFDSASLARAILKGIKDEEVRKRMVTEGEIFVQNFDWKRVTEQYRKLIFNILKVYGPRHH